MHLFAGSTHYPLAEQMLYCFLGLCCSPLSAVQAAARDRGLIASDGFVDPAHRVLMAGANSRLKESTRVIDAVADCPTVGDPFLLGPRRLGVRVIGSPLGLLLAHPATHAVPIDVPGGGAGFDAPAHSREVSTDAALSLVDSARLLSVRLEQG